MNISLPLNTSDTINKCDHMDASYNSIINMKNQSSESIYSDSDAWIYAIVIVISFVVLVCGSRIVRPVAFLVSVTTSFYIVFYITSNSSGLSCESRILSALVVSTIVACLISCIIRCTLFVVGVASFAFFVHFTFATNAELEGLVDAPVVLGRSVVYWICIVLFGWVGGLVFKWRQTEALEVTTSMLGGIGISYGLRSIFKVYSVNVDRPVLYAIGMASTLSGVLIQRKLRTNKLRISTKGPAKHTSPIPWSKT